VIYDSGVTLLFDVFAASTAGAGGPGGAGESGQIDGIPGNGAGGGCQGGQGGAGSGGNGGQGGPGGVSVGIAFSGPAPTLDGMAVSEVLTSYPGVTVASAIATGGAGGAKGGVAVVSGNPWPGALPGNDGATGSAGVSLAVRSF
jgi:hypothetical protein